MTGRMLQLTHTGRVSGEPRHVILEVVKHDPSMDIYYVAVAWEEQSDWVKNIQANPEVQVKVGKRNLNLVAEQLTQDESEAVILDYSQKHKSTMMNLAKFMGYKLDGSEADFRELGRMLMMFALKPENKGTAQ